VTGPCQRFEQEGLLQLEQGLPLDRHFATCPECQRIHAQYRRIWSELRQGSSAVPRPGWEQRVFEAIDRSQAPVVRRRAWRVWRWGALGVAAAVAALTVTVWRTRPPASALSLSTELIEDHGQLRGNGVQIGDRLRVRAVVAAARYAELRVYRDDRELVLRCAPDAGQAQAVPRERPSSCSREGAILQSELRLGSAGAFQPFVVASDAALPPPAPTLAEDSARLVAAGARIALGPAIRVY